MSDAAVTRRDWRAIALASLLPLSALIAFVREIKLYGYGLAAPEVMILAAAIAAVTLVVGALVARGPRVLRPMLVSGVILHMLLVEQVGPNGSIWLQSLPVHLKLPIFLAVIVGVGVAVWRLRENAQLILATVLGVTLFGLVVEVGLLRESHAAGPRTSGSTGGAADRPAGAESLPPVVHVVLDGHIGLDGIPLDIPGAAAARAEVESLYLRKGFALYPRAFSHFVESQLSLSVMMNAGPISEPFAFIQPKSPHGYAVHRNRWLETLKDAGYRVTVYHDFWVDYCAGTPDLIDTCHTYPVYEPMALKGSGVPLLKRTEILGRYFARRFLPWGIVEVPPPLPLNALNAVEALLRDLEEGLDGNAYLVHLLLPHEGFVLDERCRPLEGFGTWREDHSPGRTYNTAKERRDRYVAYLRQVRCATRLVGRIIETLERLNAFDRAIVVVHGDHGSRIAQAPYKGADPAVYSDRDVLDHFSALYAVKAPGVVPGMHDERASVQDLFARHLFGEQRPPSPPEVYVRSAPDWGLPLLSRQLPAS